MIDTNVHLSLYGGQNVATRRSRSTPPRQDDIVLEAAQIDLSHGITTVRDSYGALLPRPGSVTGIAQRAGGHADSRRRNILGTSGPSRSPSAA